MFNTMESALYSPNIPVTLNETQFPLIKLSIRRKQNFELLFEQLKSIQNQFLLYLTLEINDAQTIESLVKKEDVFSNYILGIEDNRLTEEEYLKLYEKIN